MLEAPPITSDQVALNIYERIVLVSRRDKEQVSTLCLLWKLNKANRRQTGHELNIGAFGNIGR